MIMVIRFDYEQLRKLIKDFAELTGATVCLFDVNYKPFLAYPAESAGICKLIKSTKSGNLGCIYSDTEGCKQAQKTKGTVVYECHAGLRDTVTPIICNNTVLGYIMFGQIADKSVSKAALTARVVEKCKKYDLKERAVKKALKELRLYDEERINSAANVMLACASYIYLSNLVKIENSDLVNEITRFIERNYKNDLTVDDICNRFYISRNKLFNLFRKEFNTTPNVYLTKLRIDKSKELLLSSDDQISTIAEKVGVPDYNYFIKLFRKETGTTPLRFRKNARC